MRSIYKPIILFIAILFATFLPAQDCSQYFPYQQGTRIEMTQFDAKDKEQGKTTQEVIRFEESSGGFSATVKMKVEDKKGKEEFETEMTLHCDQGVFKVDMDQYITPEMRESFKDMEFEIESRDLEIPLDLKVGQQLNDGKITMKASSGGMGMMNFTVNILNRKVEAKEKVVSPAGEFDCFKISYELETQMMIKMKTLAAEWIAPGVGVVKTAEYSKSGKLKSYTLLTAIEQP